jgi:hypothetical protein
MIDVTESGFANACPLTFAPLVFGRLGGMPGRLSVN